MDERQRSGRPPTFARLSSSSHARPAGSYPGRRRVGLLGFATRAPKRQHGTAPGHRQSVPPTEHGAERPVERTRRDEEKSQTGQEDGIETWDESTPKQRYALALKPLESRRRAKVQNCPDQSPGRPSRRSLTNTVHICVAGFIRVLSRYRHQQNRVQ